MNYKKEKSIQARRIKELRERNGDTQESLADILRISKQSLSKIEQDRSNLTLENAIGIAKHYKVSVDYICGLADSSTIPQNVLDTLCNYISISTASESFQENHKIPYIHINEALFHYLNVLDQAKMLKEKQVPEEVIDVWVETETRKTLANLLQCKTSADYALLSQRHIASDEVMALIEKAYNEST